MSFYNKIIKFLYYRLRKDSHEFPSRKGYNLNGSYVHPSVDVSSLKCEYKNSISAGCIFFGDVKLGSYTTSGINCIFHGGKIEIGKFCQIGPYTSFYSIDHPQEYLTIYNSKYLLNSKLKKLSIEGDINIGHGVWIGHGAVILKGVKIGNGAIIGANSVISKDVPSYAVIAGVPGKLLKFRFNEDIIKLIEDSKWWDRPIDFWEKNQDLLMKRLVDYSEDDRRRLLTANHNIITR